MKKSNKYLLASFGALSLLVATSIVISNSDFSLIRLTAGDEKYSITLDSTNKVTSAGEKVQKTKLGNDVTFTYSNVANSTSGHVTLNDGGYLNNKDWITSITAFTCTFSGGNSLTAKLAYGGDAYNDGFTLTSGERYEIGSNPYFVKLVSNGVTTIESFKVEYSCISTIDEHSTEVEDSTDDYYRKVTTASSSVVGDYLIVYEASETSAKIFDGSLTTLDASGNHFSATISDGKIAATDEIDAAVFHFTSGAYVQSSSGYYLYNDSYSNALPTTTSSRANQSISVDATGELTLEGKGGATLRFNSNTGTGENRFRYYKNYGQKAVMLYEKVAGSSSGSHTEYDIPEKECIGFSVSDSKQDSYKMTDVFDTANGLIVTAHYSDGTSQAISRGGTNGYSYVVTDKYGETINTATDFGNLGGNDKETFTVTVSYSASNKNFIDQTYQITVGFVTKITGIEVNSDYLEFNTAQKLSDFTSNISADLTYNKQTLSGTVEYAGFSEAGLALTLLDPDDVIQPITNVFGTAGTWTIKITSTADSSVYGEVDINVKAIQVTNISVSANGGSASVEEESTLQLTAAVTPNNATNQTVTWSSGNTSVATVNNNGLVTGVAEGVARITATASDGSEVYGYIDVTVTKKPVLDYADAAMYDGEKCTAFTVNGHDAIKAGTSKAAGSINITIPKGSTKLSMYISAWSGTSPTVAMSLPSGSGSILPSSVTPIADSCFTGSETSFRTNQAESTYYKEFTLTGISGDTTLTLSSSGRFIVWLPVYYTTQVDPVYPTSISLSGTQSISVGGTSQIAVAYTPADTNVKDVTFSSSNTSVATVSSDGLVTGVAAGNATITATAQKESGTTSATINITVTAVAVESVSLNKSAITLSVSGTEQLTATISPNNAGNKSVTWTSSNTEVATVANGLVTGVSAGSATITVTTLDGGKTSTCLVTVVGSGSGGGGTGTSGVASIAISDIPTTYNTSSGNTIVDGITYTVYNVASSYTSGSMQWKKSSGYIENTTPIEGLINITIAETSGKSFSGTLYSGTSQSPNDNATDVTSGNTYTFSGSVSYFKLAVNSTTGYTGDINLAYSTTPVDPTSISVSPSSVELAKGGTKELSVSYTPSNANQNKDVTWSRQSGSSNISVSSSGVVSVSSNASVGNSAVIRATLQSNASIYSQCNVSVIEQAGDDQTILIYMCGSDLESNGQTNSSKASGYASGDISEILKVGSQPDNVNVVLETGGAKCWKTTYGINKDYLERYHVANKRLVRDSQETKANMGSSSTLQSFLTWGIQTYPADRISLILWNHGGAMRGVCYDENYSSDSLTNSEVKSAVKNTFTTLGRSTSDKLEWIGYDACLMQVQDIAEFNSTYFNYMVGSEESEAGDGWDYDTWLDDAYANKPTSTILNAIVDGFIADTNAQYATNGWGASDQTLSWLDLSYMSAYKSAWETMAAKLLTLSINKSNFQTMMKTVKYYGSDSDCEGYSYFGIFDAKDTLNKLKSNYSGASSEITAALSAFDNLVKYSKKGSGAGNSYGLCCFFPMKDGSGYTCSTSSVYTSSQTNFSSWRSIVTSYGD